MVFVYVCVYRRISSVVFYVGEGEFWWILVEWWVLFLFC